MDNDLTLFISTPDSYTDIMGIFLECFHRNWQDCPYELVISTNTKHYDCQNVTVLDNNDKNDGWMNRAIPALKQIKSKYVMLLCDDCFILKTVHNSQVRAFFKEVKEHNLDFCGMTNYIKGPKFEGAKYINKVRKNKAYAKNLQTGIYKREYLLSELGDGSLDPWELEAKWLKQASRGSKEYYDNIASCSMNILNCVNGIAKGKWFESALDAVQKSGIEVKTERGVIPFSQEKKMDLMNKIGKVIPSSARADVKKILGHFGVKFSTDN